MLLCALNLLESWECAQIPQLLYVQAAKLVLLSFVNRTNQFQF